MEVVKTLNQRATFLYSVFFYIIFSFVIFPFSISFLYSHIYFNRPIVSVFFFHLDDFYSFLLQIFPIIFLYDFFLNFLLRSGALFIEIGDFYYEFFFCFLNNMVDAMLIFQRLLMKSSRGDCIYDVFTQVLIIFTYRYIRN